jgi:hypothetical protein
MKHIVSVFLLFISACASKPKCGYPEGAKIVFENDKSCHVRIRQVVVGTDFKIPESLKSTALISYEINWRDTVVENGRVVMGHFVLIPQGTGQDREK